MITRSEINAKYFEWMYQLVCGNDCPRRVSYRKLLDYLHSMEFYYILPMDGNRSEDGIELRYRFGHENNYDDCVIAKYLDDAPCSVLEMMIALAIRCEEHIMDDPDVGNRTGQWFWNMIVNLGLGSMSDERFVEDFVDKVVTRFLNREYKSNGDGGLFTVHYPQRDMRFVEIWYQMCWYLDENV